MDSWPPQPPAPEWRPVVAPPAAPGRVPWWAWVLGCGGVGCMGLVALLVGFLIYVGTCTPGTEAVAGSEMKESDLQTLRELGLLEKDERVLYFFSDGTWSIKEDGNYFTDRRVVSYEGLDSQKDGGERMVEQATWDQVDDLSVKYAEGWLENSMITVRRKDGKEFALIVSNDNHGDRKFYLLLRSTWAEKSGRPVEAEDQAPAEDLDSGGAKPQN